MLGGGGGGGPRSTSIRLFIILDVFLSEQSTPAEQQAKLVLCGLCYCKHDLLHGLAHTCDLSLWAARFGQFLHHCIHAIKCKAKMQRRAL